MKVKILCECGCNQTRMVNESDIKRGWGRFFSKSCKAKAQAEIDRQRGVVRKYQKQWRNNYDTDMFGV